MGQKYLSDIIDEKTIDGWSDLKDVVIDTTTGSGKTTFVFNRLLPYAAKKKMYVIYICNRKAIKHQVTQALGAELNKDEMQAYNAIPKEMLKYLRVETYQHFEASNSFWMDFTDKPEIAADIGHKSELKFKDRDRIDNIGSNIRFIVFDEAHYFMSDAPFNANTDFWIKTFQSRPQRSQYVFFTATPERLYYFLRTAHDADSLIDPIIGRLVTEREVAKAANYVAGNIEAAGQLIRLARFGNMPRNRLVDELELIGSFYPSSLQTEQSNSIFPTNWAVRAYEEYRKRKIDQYEEPIKYLRYEVEMLKQNRKMHHIEAMSLSANYSNTTAFYFSDYKELYDLIASSPKKEKWLIFVDKKADGFSISEALNSRGCTTAFVSSDNVRNRSGHAEYERVINESRFNSKVLVATEVFDCGVSIHDKNVKNIVISHSRKSTFLQMLGRVRVDKSDKINLYIRQFASQTIYGLMKKLKDGISFAVDFYTLSAYSPYIRLVPLPGIRKSYKYEQLILFDTLTASNGMKYMDIRDEFPVLCLVMLPSGMEYMHINLYQKSTIKYPYMWKNIQKTHTKIFWPGKSTCMYKISRSPYVKNGERKRIFKMLLEDRSMASLVKVSSEQKIQRNNPNLGLYPSSFGMEINKNGFISMLYDLSLYEDAIRMYEGDGENNQKDRAFYIKYQLGWLGMEYHEENWVGYAESNDALTAYLAENEGDWVLPEKMKKELFECFKLCTFLPNELQKDLAKYKRDDRLPGLKKLNAALRERKIGYHIESKQRFVGGIQATYWRFVPDTPRDFDV